MMGELKGRILCVDDHKDACDMVSALLGIEGYQVIQANSITDGLSAAMSEDFDLILLDWFFKDGSGIELCKVLTSNGLRTPILFYSDGAESSELHAAMKAGAHGFLVKPMDVNDRFAHDVLKSVSRFVRNRWPNAFESQEYA
jgi:DNA-binding response OmpR family regulator